MIWIKITYSGIRISDDAGNNILYIDYSKKEALRLFKERFGYKGVRGIVIIEEGR